MATFTVYRWTGCICSTSIAYRQSSWWLEAPTWSPTQIMALPLRRLGLSNNITQFVSSISTYCLHCVQLAGHIPTHHRRKFVQWSRSVAAISAFEESFHCCVHLDIMTLRNASFTSSLCSVLALQATNHYLLIYFINSITDKVSYCKQIACQHSWSRVQKFSSHLLRSCKNCLFSYCVRAYRRPKKLPGMLGSCSPVMGRIWPLESCYSYTCFHTKFGRSRSNRLSAGKGSQKFGGRLGAVIWSGRMVGEGSHGDVWQNYSSEDSS